jgi:hypothetical protein
VNPLLPLVLNCRARRAIYVAGEYVAAGEITVMLFDDAMQAVAAGSVEIVGSDSERVGIAPAFAWSDPQPEPVRQQSTGEWMRPTGSTASSEPQRIAPAMELAAQRWQR